jgi:hypothetical protein
MLHKKLKITYLQASSDTSSGHNLLLAQPTEVLPSVVGEIAEELDIAQFYASDEADMTQVNKGC